jgi:phosphoglycolate phosphatase
LRWGIVTNKVGALTLPLVAALGLVERCACIVSGDSTPHPKPAPDPLLLACSQAGVAPNTCLFVGDDERDIVAGRAARMATAVAQWGYLGHNTDFRAWGADALLACPGDIIDLIELRRAA